MGLREGIPARQQPTLIVHLQRPVLEILQHWMLADQPVRLMAENSLNQPARPGFLGQVAHPIGIGEAGKQRMPPIGFRAGELAKVGKGKSHEKPR